MAKQLSTAIVRLRSEARRRGHTDELVLIMSNGLRLMRPLAARRLMIEAFFRSFSAAAGLYVGGGGRLGCSRSEPGVWPICGKDTQRGRDMLMAIGCRVLLCQVTGSAAEVGWTSPVDRATGGVQRCAARAGSHRRPAGLENVRFVMRPRWAF